MCCCRRLRLRPTDLWSRKLKSIAVRKLRSIAVGQVGPLLRLGVRQGNWRHRGRRRRRMGRRRRQLRPRERGPSFRRRLGLRRPAREVADDGSSSAYGAAARAFGRARGYRQRRRRVHFGRRRPPWPNLREAVAKPLAQVRRGVPAHAGGLAADAQAEKHQVLEPKRLRMHQCSHMFSTIVLDPCTFVESMEKKVLGCIPSTFALESEAWRKNTESINTHQKRASGDRRGSAGAANL